MLKTYAVNKGRNFLIMLDNLPQMDVNLLQKGIQKTAERTVDLIGYKITDEITKVSRSSQIVQRKLKVK